MPEPKVRRGKVLQAVGVVGVEALSRKATCLLFIHLESDAHKVNPCVRHWACTTHNYSRTYRRIQQATRRRTKVEDRKGRGEEGEESHQNQTYLIL